MKKTSLVLKFSDGLEYRYELTALGASVLLEGSARLMNIAGPAVAVLPDQGLMGFSMAELIGRLTSNRDLAEHLKWFAAAFASRTQVVLPNGTTRTLTDVCEEHFAGELAALSDWLRAGFELNYGAFLAPARAAFGKFFAIAIEAEKRASKPQNDAPRAGSGPSGESSQAASSETATSTLPSNGV